MPLSEEALSSVLVSEPSVLVNQTLAATATLLSSNAVCPDGWTTRIIRLVVANRDNAVRLLSIYAGDTADRDRTLMLSIPLSNYERLVLEEDQLRKMIHAARAASSQNNQIYALVDGVTVGVHVVLLQYVQERM